MATTSRMKWEIPPEEADAWYSRFLALFQQVDASVYASREDRQLILTGGGAIRWTLSTRTLQWSGVITIKSPIGGFIESIAANNVLLEEGQVLYTTLGRYPVANQTLTVAVSNKIPVDPRGDDVYLLAVRMNNKIYWRNGAVLADGDIIQDFKLGGFVAGGDLASVPVDQTVIGIQTTPVLDTAPAVDQVLFFNGAAWEPFKLTQDHIDPAFVPTLAIVGGNLREMQSNVVTPAFTAGYVPGLPNTAFLDDDEPGHDPKNVSGTPTSFSSDYSFMKDSWSDNSVVFALTATRGTITRYSYATMTWTVRVFWGSALDPGPGSYTKAWLEALAVSDLGPPVYSGAALATSRARIFTTNAPTSSGKYIFYAFRSDYGIATFKVGGFEGGFIRREANVSILNDAGWPENYDIWRSEYPDLGVTTVTVT